MRWGHGRMIRGVSSVLAVMFLSAMLLGSMAGVLPAQDKKPLADRHKDKGLDCAVCHKEPPPAKVKAESCVMCHGDAAKLAERTKGKTPNPHALPTLDCAMCHSGHK
jgi:Cytochrome c3